MQGMALLTGEMKLGDKLKQFRTWAVVQGGKFIQFKQIFSSNQMA